MEKKTIGTFIAALRKASGLTQRQLADKLNVSDKAVSRWERDECAPDLSLIPVLAEIFNVTSDEILRGQRQNPDIPVREIDTAKSEKQRKNLLLSIRSQFRIRSVVFGFLALVGLLLAFMLNSESNAPNLGFLISLIFTLAAVVLQITNLMAAVTSLGDEDDGELLKCKTSMGYWSESIICICLIALCLCIPMAGSQEAVSFLNRLTAGCKWALGAAVLCLAVFLPVNIVHTLRHKSGVPALLCRTLTSLLLIGVLIGHISLNTFLVKNRHVYAPCETFSDLQDFKYYMQTPLSPEGYYCYQHRDNQGTPSGNDYVYIFNNPYTEEISVYSSDEIIKTLIAPTNPNWSSENRFKPEFGYEFYHYNRNVVHYEATDTEDIVPIYTFTVDQFRQSEKTAANYSLLYCLIYLVPIGIGYSLYFLLNRKRK